MNQWKAILGLLCLAVWLPATQHCKLENLPGLAFLPCPTDTPGNSDCEGDSCGMVEKGAYKAPNTREAAVVALLVAILTDPIPALESRSQAGSSEFVLMAAPTRKRLESWQSYSSVALPIRGPSCLS